MAISLEELKRQREQIKKHLEWLDANIAELSDNQVETSDDAPDKVIQVPPPEGAQACNVEEPPAESSSKAPAFIPDPEAPTYKAKTQGELRRAKIGCLMLFVICTALFLFLLFGLPYLLPEKTEEPENQIIQEAPLNETFEENSMDELAE